MAINKNHEFDDLNGIKCAIVEKNVNASRVEFLKRLLGYNGYTLQVVAAPPPKTVAAGGAAEQQPVIETPTLFTVGVTDVMFNATNAIFGRLLHTPDGHVVTLAYWQQKETVSDDDTPYFEKNNGG